MDNHKAARTNDTKELNQVQLLLLARAKLVDNSGDDSGMVGWLEGLGLPALLSTVDAGPVRHHGLTGSPRVFPPKPNTVRRRNWRSEKLPSLNTWIRYLSQCGGERGLFLLRRTVLGSPRVFP